MFNTDRNRRVLISLAGFALAFGAAYLLASRGVYGWTLFVLLPILAGGLGAWSLKPITAGAAARIGATVGAVGSLLFLVLGLEGFFCVLMALPVTVPLATLGGLLAYWCGAALKGKKPAAICLLLPVSFLFDINAKPPVYSVTTSAVVNAAPERVWEYVVAFPEITDEPDWLLRTGVAYPIRTRLAGRGAGAPRSCDLSTGPVQERVVIWDQPRTLRFLVTSTPPAMVETGLYGPISPKHLSGYFISMEGQFQLTRLPGNRTLLVGTSWYRHGLWPAEYWRCWSDTIVHHIHKRVLDHIRALSEKATG